MRELDRYVRLAVYEHFARTGKPPTLESLCERAQCSRADVEAALSRLETDHHALALAPTTSNIWMAHPFSAVPTRFRVETNDIDYWGNCAWDALTIPSLLSLDAQIPARCEETGEPIELALLSGSIVDSTAPDGVVHFAVPPRRFWENVGYT